MRSDVLMKIGSMVGGHSDLREQRNSAAQAGAIDAANTMQMIRRSSDNLSAYDASASALAHRSRNRSSDPGQQDRFREGGRPMVAGAASRPVTIQLDDQTRDLRIRSSCCNAIWPIGSQESRLRMVATPLLVTRGDLRSLQGSRNGAETKIIEQMQGWLPKGDNARNRQKLTGKTELLHLTLGAAKRLWWRR